MTDFILNHSRKIWLLLFIIILATGIVFSQDAKLNLADFEYIPEKNLLIVPTLYGNKLLAFKLDLQNNRPE